MPLQQRYRSNSSSSTLVAPLSPTYGSMFSGSSDATISRANRDHVNLPCSSSSLNLQEEMQQEATYISSCPRVSLTPIGNAAGVMKKLLRRRRGYTSGGDGDDPLSPSSLHSFVMLNGRGSATAGTTANGPEPLQHLSPSTGHFPQSPVSPISPKSPTFSQSMFTRITGKDTARSPIASISLPTTIPMSDRSHLDSMTNGHLDHSLTLSAPFTRRKMNRRSLSADGLWATNAYCTSNMEQHSDKSIGKTTQHWKQMSLETLVNRNAMSDNEQPEAMITTDHRQSTWDRNLEDQRATQASHSTNPESYTSSTELLNTHHRRTNTADNWSNRCKQKTLVSQQDPSKADPRSQVTNILTKSSNTNADIAKTACAAETSAFGAAETWRDFDPASTSVYMDMDPDSRSLLSSVDILMVPSISSPTQYYDDPDTRSLLQTYLTSRGREFDEMIEFGFPAGVLLEEKEGIASDCRFLTLRLTLTPWHARADESKLYGPEDAEKNVPLKGMVNKFLSRTSAILSCSPPKDRKSTITDPSGTPIRPPRGSSPDFEKTAVCVSQQSHSDAHRPGVSLEKASAIVEDPEPGSSLRGAHPLKISPPPKSLERNKAGQARREKSFRTMDTSIMAVPTTIIRSVRSAELLDKAPEFYASPPSTPSPTSLFQYQQQQPQSPRKASLSALSLPINTFHASGTEECVPVLPVVPPRRKASSPAILLKETEVQLQALSTHVTIPCSSMTITSSSASSTKSLSTSPPSPKPTTSGIAMPVPLPLSHPSKQSQHAAPWTEKGVYGSPSARIPGPLARQRVDQRESMTPPRAQWQPALAMPRHDIMMMMTNTTTPTS
ncbi:hypothetical protein BGZ50_000434 [Haplosporangium sp. Z 11]|nr:hypothetical protein BGZ50_000434 [Haplosporangium sp. Z 11]